MQALILIRATMLASMRAATMWGMSWIIAVGQLEGGQLWVEDDKGDVPMTARRDFEDTGRRRKAKFSKTGLSTSEISGTVSMG